jgi:hypothetical protein
MGGNSDVRHPAYPHAELVQAARELVAAIRRSCPIDAEPQTPAGKAADLFGEGPSAGAGPDSVGSAWEEFGPLTSWLNVTLPEDPPLEPGIPQPTKAAIYAIYTNTNRSLLGAMLRFYETYYGKVWPRIKEARERNMSRATLPTFSSQDLDEFLAAANYLAEVAGVRGDGSPGAHQTPATPQDAAGGGDDDDQDVAHSDDFRSVRWFGQVYEFTTTQASCVKVLWEHWERGTPTVGQETILEAAGAGGDRLRDIFDKGKHPAWGTMIVEARKGAFRLQERSGRSS